MSVTIKIEESAAILTVEGKLMGEKDTADMIEKVKEVIADGTTKMVVDLSEVAWLSSTALGVLLKFHKAFDTSHGFFRLAGLTDKVLNLLRHTNLDKIFSVHKTVEDALSHSKRDELPDSEEDDVLEI